MVEPTNQAESIVHSSVSGLFSNLDEVENCRRDLH